MSVTIEAGKSYVDYFGRKQGPMEPWAGGEIYFHVPGAPSLWPADGLQAGNSLVEEWHDHNFGVLSGICSRCGQRETVARDTHCAPDPTEWTTVSSAELLQELHVQETSKIDPADPVKLTGERKNTHGNWVDQARVGVQLDDAAQNSPGYAALAPYQKKAVDMILVKLSRIVSGDASHDDHWDDIAGYAHLGKGGHGVASVSDL